MKTKDEIFNKAFLLLQNYNKFTIDKLKHINTLFKFKNKADAIQRLERIKWKKLYETSNNPYLFYEEDSYLITATYLYKFLSKQYIDNFLSIKNDIIKNDNIKILDYGAGTGLTTLYLALNLPKATIYYFNISKKQTNFFKQLLKEFTELNNIIIINNLDLIKNINIDLLFILDVIEHCKMPLDEMLYILKDINSKYIIQTGGWSGNNIPGHFSIYQNNLTPRETIKQIKLLYTKFNYKLLNNENLIKYNKKFWNNEPHIYYKN